MKRILLVGLLLISIVVNAFSQVKNLDRLSQTKRDSILISLAKETILKYGPDFYEENVIPVITRKTVTEEELKHKKEEVYNKQKKNLGRSQYIVL